MNNSWRSFYSLDSVFLILTITILYISATQAQVSKKLIDDIDIAANMIEPQVIEWRRDFHQYPELGNREIRTSNIIVKHLKELGIDV
jgi:amidohydrolase